MGKSILLFGLGSLQKSILQKASSRGLETIGIDPCENPVCKNLCDVFYRIDGQDFGATLEVARRHGVSAVVTAATDKPLVMMARVAAELGLNFFTEDTARVSTDKYLMKQRFLEAGISCAAGRLVTDVSQVSGMDFPLIVKPCDNSGSRGVKLCRDAAELSASLDEAMQFTRKKEVLVENFIKGREYSIESLHVGEETHIVQFTEKMTTDFPYNVELGHFQPARLSREVKDRIYGLVCRIAKCLGFRDCASHTEIKIDGEDIYVIETSPRTGGDYITSDLTGLSSGIDMENLLLDISLGLNPAGGMEYRSENCSAIRFFSLRPGVIEGIDPEIDSMHNSRGVKGFSFDLKAGDRVRPITNSLDRYGHIIVSAGTRDEVDRLLAEYMAKIEEYIHIGL